MVRMVPDWPLRALEEWYDAFFSPKYRRRIHGHGELFWTLVGIAALFKGVTFLIGAVLLIALFVLVLIFGPLTYPLRKRWAA